MAHPGPRSIPRELIRPLLNRPGTPRANRGGSAYRPRSAVVKWVVRRPCPRGGSCRRVAAPIRPVGDVRASRRTRRPQCAIGAARHRLENEQSTCRASNRKARRTGLAPRTRRATPSDEPPPGGRPHDPLAEGGPISLRCRTPGPRSDCPARGARLPTPGVRATSRTLACHWLASTLVALPTAPSPGIRIITIEVVTTHLARARRGRAHAPAHLRARRMVFECFRTTTESPLFGVNYFCRSCCLI